MSKEEHKNMELELLNTVQNMQPSIFKKAFGNRGFIPNSILLLLFTHNTTCHACY